MTNTDKRNGPRPRVYLARKISAHGWRDDLTGQYSDLPDPLDPRDVVELRDYVLTGPFFSWCGHGMAHGSATHGCELRGRDGNHRQRVFDANIARIEDSDLMFAHINEIDCPGTIFEIGHAHARGIPTFLHFGLDLTDREKQELWFPAKACIPVLGEIEDAFACALAMWSNSMAAARIG